ncbi:MAG: ABC transporter substrate-binding protein [Thermomicrobiales bacterium]
MLLWQVPTVLNQHVSTGGKDTTASGLYMEPLLNFTPESTLVTRLAAEVSVSNGGIAPDFSSVTYKLKEGVLWSDGEPFTAADVRFTYEWVSNPENAATTFENYSNVASVDVIDDLTVTVNFTTPTLAWYIPFVGTNGGSILPGHVWGFDATDTGPNTNFRTAPVGTWTISSHLLFRRRGTGRPSQRILPGAEQALLSPAFRSPAEPATSEGAARAVLQTGEADWAWNIQVAPDVIADMANGGTGQMITFAGVATEAIYINFTDPNTEASTGERSSLEIPHPSLTDLAVRQAMNCARSIATSSRMSSTATVSPVRGGTWSAFRSTKTTLPVQLRSGKLASQILDEAGWVLDGNVRSKDENRAELRLSHHQCGAAGYAGGR